MRRVAAAIILTVAALTGAGLVGASARGDYQGEEPLVDVLTGAGLLAAAAAVRWALAELELEAPLEAAPDA
jgi:hypothetical protein